MLYIYTRFRSIRKEISHVRRCFNSNSSLSHQSILSLLSVP